MGLRARWDALQKLDRTLILMFIVAALALSGVYFGNTHAATNLLQGATDNVPTDSPGRKVLVILNMDDVQSVQIGMYYVKKRQVPKSNIVMLHCSTDEEVTQSVYDETIEKPVTTALKASKNPVDYMLFIKGVPIRVKENGYSVDCEVATAEAKSLVKEHKTEIGPLYFIENPYFNKAEHFSRAKFGYCLPCRLDGYTMEDAEALVDNSLAAKPQKGPFLLDGTDSRNTGGYESLNKDLGTAAEVLKKKNLDVVYDPGPTFVGSDLPLEGYASWGSNDAKFDVNVYRSLKFKPGAISETFVSTSGRTFRPTNDGGQSLVADLIHQGVTGIKCYVSEPYVFALARPALLFDRYTSGYNLAESFWMASLTMRWKEIVIGDPLCNPYHK